MSAQPKIVLLPGMDGTGELFAPFLAVAPAGFEVQIVRYPSDEPLGYAALVERVWTGLPSGGERFALVAESFSGPIALEIAARAPEGLFGVVLVASFAENPYPRLARVVEPFARASTFDLPMPLVAVRHLMLGEDSTPEIAKSVREVIRGVDPEVLATRAREVLVVDAKKALAKVQVPTLFLGGAEDRLLPPTLADDLAKVLPSIERVTIAGPHLLLQRSPKAAADVIGEFLGRALSPSSRRSPG
jgi:pimeloyl-ACP methyl ester carboxylesterase